MNEKLKEQVFHAGDLVQIAKDLGQGMSHFTGDCRAIVVGSYTDQYGCDSDHSRSTFTLWLEGRGQSSWYDEWQLTLIEKGRADLLLQWKAEREARETMTGDIDWIFANGPDVCKSTPGASVATLGKLLGIDNLWGSRGEGITYYTNALGIMAFAEPYLMAGDKAGFLAAARSA